MKFADNTKKIKKALLKGGLVVAGRGTGKTRALAEILLENPNSIVIADNNMQLVNLRFLLKGKMLDSDIMSRILTVYSADKRLLGKHPKKDIYLEEYVMNSYKGEFKAAVTSFPFPVTVIK